VLVAVTPRINAGGLVTMEIQAEVSNPGDAAAGDLEDLTADERIDLDVREAAVFALSEIDGDAGFDALMRIARGEGDPRIREKAFFWLADSGDPRALALFEEILAGS